MNDKQIILNRHEILNKISRIAFSIIEDFHNESKITFIGLNENGFLIAKKIKKIIQKECDINVTLHKLTFEKNSDIIMNPEIKYKPKNIFLVDDVLKSGKTIIYAIKEILKYEVHCLKTVILVNRNHNRFPIGVDYIGLNLSTTLKDHIEVIMEKDNESAYLV